jgi:ketosteroid isomerase-like protein
MALHRVRDAGSLPYGMYHALVRRRIGEVFDALSRSEWQRAVDDLAPDVYHVFPGTHALGGERHSRDSVARWFERLDRLFPGHDFTVARVLSRGWPSNTWVAVQWSARLTPRVGESYVNEGAHWLQIRWGKVTYFHAYLDSQRVADACREMAVAGIDEAAADPIDN